MVAVEVRWGTLGSGARGRGPAGNTGRGWSRLIVRSGGGGGGRRGGGGGGGGGGGDGADVKSNNPHLTGGESSSTPGFAC